MKGSSTMLIGCALVAVVLFSGMLYFNGFDKYSQNNDVKKFESLTEIQDYLKNNMGTGYYGYGAMGGARTLATTSAQAMDTAAPTAEKSAGNGATDFSTTNIQVEGVDEADVIKNDDKYIYTISGNNVVIVDAYPAENAKIISQINMSNNSYANNIFINGDQLVVFGAINEPYPYYGGYGGDIMVKTEGASAKVSSESFAMPRYYYSSKMFVNIYDVADRSNPTLVKNITIEGDYFDSRMIGNYVYLVSTKYIYDQNNVVLPMAEGVREDAAFPGVYYFDNSDNSYMFATVFAINTNGVEEPTRQIFMLGAAQQMYVSQENIFIVYTKYLSMADFLDRYVDEVIKPLVPADVDVKIDQIMAETNASKMEKMNSVSMEVSTYADTLNDDERQNFYNTMYDSMNNIQQQMSKQMEKTIIHKLSINGNRVEYKSNGEVPGHVLNQFSMDEHNDYFRVATTTGTWEKEQNNVYVLDSALNNVGKLEDLAQGEKIYSARFIGDRLYLVTFKKTDPLFVINLATPTNPTVLGELKIPGYSDYLHAYDDNHIIGVGKSATEDGDNAWYQGVKIALFDVSDVTNPKELSNFIIGDRGTQSDALYDHKAFLFSKSKNLLVLPISLAEIDESKYEGQVPSWAWGDTVWQGAYVFSVTLDGIKLRDRVTHMTNITKNEYGYYDLPYEYNIRRSIYMDEVLYTFSEKMIKMNSLNDLSETNKIELPGYPVIDYPDYPVPVLF
jgi:inhibitor of cysteine peptidase